MRRQMKETPQADIFDLFHQDACWQSHPWILTDLFTMSATINNSWDQTDGMTCSRAIQLHQVTMLNSIAGAWLHWFACWLQQWSQSKHGTRRRAPTASCTRLQIKWWQLKFLQTTDSFLRVRVIQNYVDIFPINVISLLHESLRPDRKSGGGEEPRMQFAVVHFNICEFDTSRCFQWALKTFSNCVCCKKNLTESQDPFRHIF